jgi:hypothetical protein
LLARVPAKSLPEPSGCGRPATRRGPSNTCNPSISASSIQRLILYRSHFPFKPTPTFKGQLLARCGVEVPGVEAGSKDKGPVAAAV